MKQNFLNIKTYSSVFILASALASSFTANAGVYIDQTHDTPQVYSKKQEAFEVISRKGEVQESKSTSVEKKSENVDFHSEYMKNQKANQEAAKNKLHVDQNSESKVILSNDQQKEITDQEKDKAPTFKNKIGHGKEFIEKDVDSKIQSPDIQKKKLDEQPIINNVEKSQINDQSITISQSQKTSYFVKMNKGFLSNSMREELQKRGWTLEWNSGSDREISVEYSLNCKNVVDFVTQISELYSIKIDVYSLNKTVNIKD